MLVLHVGGLADVLLQVEQRQADLVLAVGGWDAAGAARPACHRAVAVREVQLPLAGADGL